MKNLFLFLFSLWFCVGCNNSTDIKGYYTIDKSTLKEKMNDIVNNDNVFESIVSKGLIETINLEILIKKDSLILHLIGVSNDKFIKSPYEFDEKTQTLTYILGDSKRSLVYIDNSLVTKDIKLIKSEDTNNLEEEYQTYLNEENINTEKRIKELEERLKELENSN